MVYAGGVGQAAAPGPRRRHPRPSDAAGLPVHRAGDQACSGREAKMTDRTCKVVIVLPAYNAAKTLLRTLAEIPAEYADHIILVDDASRDETVAVAQAAGLLVYRHDRNCGYGANQKTCYRQALAADASIVVMVHPDHQYDASV